MKGNGRNTLLKLSNSTLLHTPHVCYSLFSLLEKDGIIHLLHVLSLNISSNNASLKILSYFLTHEVIYLQRNLEVQLKQLTQLS